MIYDYDIYDGQPATGYAEILADKNDCLASKALQHNPVIMLKDKTSTTMPCDSAVGGISSAPATEI